MFSLHWGASQNPRKRVIESIRCNMSMDYARQLSIARSACQTLHHLRAPMPIPLLAQQGPSQIGRIFLEEPSRQYAHAINSAVHVSEPVEGTRRKLVEAVTVRLCFYVRKLCVKNSSVAGG